MRLMPWDGETGDGDPGDGDFDDTQLESQENEADRDDENAASQELNLGTPLQFDTSHEIPQLDADGRLLRLDVASEFHPVAAPSQYRTPMAALMAAHVRNKQTSETR